MRLIDADKVLERFRGIADTSIWCAFCNEIIKAPTVEARPKGKWVFSQRGKTTDLSCSVCGDVGYKEIAYNYPVEKLKEELDESCFSNFCPNCGADMRGDMNIKETIKLIQGIEEDGRNITLEHIEALCLAIKALEFIEENYPKTFIDYINGEQI